MNIHHIPIEALSPVDDILELSDACLETDEKTQGQVDHAYRMFRKDLEVLMHKAVSRFGQQRIQDFLDGIDSAYSDSCISMWADRINEAFEERS